MKIAADTLSVGQWHSEEYAELRARLALYQACVNPLYCLRCSFLLHSLLLRRGLPVVSLQSTSC